MKRIALCLAMLVLLLSVPAMAQAGSGGDYAVSWSTVGGGGGAASSGGDFGLSGTVGQSDPGALAGGDYSLQGGYWNVTVPWQIIYFPIIYH